MELIDFLRQTQSQVRAEINEKLLNTSDEYPYQETVFAEVVMQHMADIGMTFDDYEICHFERTVGNCKLRLTGYALSEDTDQLDLFVSLYTGAEDIQLISDSDTKQAALRCLQFIRFSLDGRLLHNLEESDDAYPFIHHINKCYRGLDEIRVYVLTDRLAKSKSYKPKDIDGITVKLEIIDIERLYRHWAEGKPRDEVVANFEQISGSVLPCIYYEGESINYDYALTALPGDALRFLYDKYGGRLLEANVRSFLSITGKVNRGIRDTIKKDPERFMAYNNGIVIVTDSVQLGQCLNGSPGIISLNGMQIVNGGQTTASIYFTKKKSPDIDLTKIRVPAKIIVLRSMDSSAEETLISEISRYANSQNTVKLSDLSSNKPFHVELEKLAASIYCPDGIGKWFYERTAGSYNVMLAREGTTQARLKQLKRSIPTSRKISKTELARYINAWDQKPHIVSLGSQKNFEQFMEAISDELNEQSRHILNPQYFKRLIAKAILFRRTQSLIRRSFKAYQANITAYLISIIANRVGDKLDLDKIWEKQDISPELGNQIVTWAHEVNIALNSSSAGRMISEWAKKPECWTAVYNADYSTISQGIPEVR